MNAQNAAKERNDVEAVPLVSKGEDEDEDETVVWQYREERTEKK